MGVNVLVRDPNGNPVSGATVSIEHPTRPGFSKSGVTDSNGLFTAIMSGAKPTSKQTLDVTVSKSGWKNFDTDAWVSTTTTGETTKIGFPGGRSKTVRFQGEKKVQREPKSSPSNTSTPDNSGWEPEPGPIPEGGMVHVGPATDSRTKEEIIEDRATNESTDPPQSGGETLVDGELSTKQLPALLGAVGALAYWGR